MSVHYVSKNMEWTEAMKECVRQRIADPLTKHIKRKDFELSVHLERGKNLSDDRTPRFAMWVVLQTLDGRNNEVVRREGEDFQHLTNDVSSHMRSKIKQRIFGMYT